LKTNLKGVEPSRLGTAVVRSLTQPPDVKISKNPRSEKQPIDLPVNKSNWSRPRLEILNPLGEVRGGNSWKKTEGAGKIYPGSEADCSLRKGFKSKRGFGMGFSVFTFRKKEQGS